MVNDVIYYTTILHLIYFNKMIILFIIYIYNKYLNIYYIIKNEYII